jgi:peptide/nickel transport system substrate-binding protein
MQMQRRMFLELVAGRGLIASVALLAACAPTPSAPAAKPSGTAPIAAQAPASTQAPAAPQPTAVPAGPIRGGSISIGVKTDAQTLDIQTLTNATTRNYARATFNSLTNVDLKGNVVPELAESWELVDPSIWEFKLRNGVKFHDGTNLDAAAVKFSMERIINPDTKSLLRADLVPSVASVEAVDPLTVHFQMTTPDVTLPARLSTRTGFIVSPTAVNKWGPDFGTHPVGTGPFELVEWVKDDHLSLKRFDGYWDKDEMGVQLPYLDTLTFKPISDATVMFTALRAGQLDLIETILPSDMAKVKSEPNLVAVEGPGPDFVMWLNNTKPPFDNKALRQAVAWAVDRDAIQKALFFDTGQPGTYLTRPGTWAYDPSGNFYTRDLAKAKAALADGGQPNGFKFELISYNLTSDVQVAQAVKAQLADVGLDMSITPLESSAAIARRNGAEYEAATGTTEIGADPDGDVQPNVDPGRASRYNNSLVNDLVLKARSTADQQERQRYYYQIQSQVLDDSPFIFLHLNSDIKVMTTALQGYQPSVEGYFGGLARLWVKK